MIIDTTPDYTPLPAFAAANRVEVVPVNQGGVITGFLNGRKITLVREDFFEAYFEACRLTSHAQH